MFRNTLLASLAVATISATSGCASIISDSSYPVAIDSTPAGADYTVVNKKGNVVHSGTTPEQVTLKAGSSYFSGEKYQITYHKEQYQETQTTLDTSIDGWYWGNLVFGGLLGMLVIDPATGAMYKLPERTSTVLTPTPVTATEPSSEQ